MLKGVACHLDAAGEKAVEKANTLFDWLTTAGMAQLDLRIHGGAMQTRNGKYKVIYT